MTPENTVASKDGTLISFVDEGRGRPLVLIHGGSGQAAHWAEAARALTGAFRVIRVERRLYGKSGIPQSPHSIGREVEDVAAVCSYLGEPVMLFGHSSGGIVALEYALRHSSTLAGLALYEPPVAVTEPLGGAALVRAKQALARGKPGKAAAIHLRDIVRISLPLFCLARLPPFWKTIRAWAREQIADTEAIEALGIGVERYSTIEIPVLLIGGTRSPGHLQDRLKALSVPIPRSEIALLKAMPVSQSLATWRAQT
jgi:pimeloyl-ACP methyl ester carboxylesterase